MKTKQAPAGLHRSGACVHSVSRLVVGASRGCRPRLIRASAVSSAESLEVKPIGLLFEADGVLVDVHRDGHRVAFNRAFAQLGLDCAHWEPAVYHDLLRIGDGSPEALVSTYFHTVGWPTMLPTKEQKQFVKKVIALKQEALQRMVDAAAIPVRPGAEQVLREALDAGARVGIIAATASSAAEGIVHGALKAMGDDLEPRVQIFTHTQGSGQGPDAAEQPTEPTFEQSMAAAQAQVKQGQARSLMRSLMRTPSMGAANLGVDSALLAGGRHASHLLSSSFLAACAALLGAPAARVAVVAALNSTIQAARGANFTALAVPPARSSRGHFSDAHAKFEGFGAGGGLTWPRIASHVQGHHPPARRR